MIISVLALLVVVLKYQQNGDAIRGRMKIRLLVGDQDPLLPFVNKYSRLATSLKIEHQLAVAAGANHSYKEIIERLPFDALSFWKSVFAKTQ